MTFRSKSWGDDDCWNVSTWQLLPGRRWRDRSRREKSGCPKQGGHRMGARAKAGLHRALFPDCHSPCIAHSWPEVWGAVTRRDELSGGGLQGFEKNDNSFAYIFLSIIEICPKFDNISFFKYFLFSFRNLYAVYIYWALMSQKQRKLWRVQKNISRFRNLNLYFKLCKLVSRH